MTAATESGERAAFAGKARAGAFVEFREAVLDFFDGPTPETLARYLDASGRLQVPSRESSKAG